MLDNEKLLFDELYEKTKDCGRIQFVELLMTKERENKELKLQLKDITHCFDEEEHGKLKKQVEERTKMYQNAYGYSQKMEGKAIILEAQQKEFIDYMNKTIEELECDDVDDEEMKDYLIQRIDTFKEILRKYKSIIGESDEKEN